MREYNKYDLIIINIGLMIVFALVETYLLNGTIALSAVVGILLVVYALFVESPV